MFDDDMIHPWASPLLLLLLSSVNAFYHVSEEPPNTNHDTNKNMNLRSVLLVPLILQGSCLLHPDRG